MREDILTNFNNVKNDSKANDAPFFSSFDEEYFLTIYGQMLIPVEMWCWHTGVTERFRVDAIFRHLCELSDSQPVTALKIVIRSIRGGWKKLYPLSEKTLKKDSHAREWESYFNEN